MFNCQKCKKTSKPHEPINRVVTVIRSKTYTNEVRDYQTGEIKTVFEGRGHETVREIVVCDKCRNKMGPPVLEVEALKSSVSPEIVVKIRKHLTAALAA